MTPIPAPQRWVYLLLATAFVLDLWFALDYGGTAVIGVPGAAAMGVCGWLAFTRPVRAALLGTASMIGSSLVIAVVDAYLGASGLASMQLTELVAGTILITTVVWRTERTTAIGLTTLIVGSCVVAVLLREDDLSSSHRTATLGTLGVMLLAGAVTTGLYLRRSSKLREDTPLFALARRQWPLAVTLGLVFLLEVRESSTHSQFMIIGLALITSACALVAPLAPARAVMVAVVAIAFGPVLTEYGRPTFYAGLGVSVTEVMACAALVAYSWRLMPRWRAAAGTVALVAANVITMGIYLRLDELDNLALVLVVTLLAVGTGLYFRARDQDRERSAGHATIDAQQAERMALARELHDVVAHHVTGIVVQAQAAQLVADDNPGAATNALERIEHSGIEALTAMRTLVGSMRSNRPAGEFGATEQATKDLAFDIGAVVERFPGPSVQLELTLPESLRDEVGRSVLRIVQESLTNVGKHAKDAAEVVVSVDHTGDEVHVRVEDDGAGRIERPVGGSGGYGLVGMRERVELLGGRFTAGPGETSGWLVEVWLPVGRQDR